MWTLLHLKYRKHVAAGDGQNGSKQTSTGKDGQDVILDVPLGTVARDSETGEALFEITEHGEKQVLLKGGRGGLGNAHFKTSTNQTPRYAQPGEEGTESWKVLELKVLADVGLVGFPNAGKSTLLSVISAAKPEIANYAFTTLVPNLGMVYYRGDRSFVMADIPGIIEGASEGKGLGLTFLRHIERNAALLFMVPCDADDIAEEYRILLRELEKYNPELMDKRRMLAITKADMLDEELKTEIQAVLPEGVQTLFISSVAQQGITELKDELWKLINE
jgi:GTP-binding protein